MLDSGANSEKLLSPLAGNLNKSANTGDISPSMTMMNSMESNMNNLNQSSGERVSQLGRDDRLLLTWHDINFSVPLSSGDRITLKKQNIRSESRTSSVAGLDRGTILEEASKQA